MNEVMQPPPPPLYSWYVAVTIEPFATWGPTLSSLCRYNSKKKNVFYWEVHETLGAGRRLQTAGEQRLHLNAASPCLLVRLLDWKYLQACLFWQKTAVSIWEHFQNTYKLITCVFVCLLAFHVFESNCFFHFCIANHYYGASPTTDPNLHVIKLHCCAPGRRQLCDQSEKVHELPKAGR